jgi:hypothetical protein
MRTYETEKVPINIDLDISKPLTDGEYEKFKSVFGTIPETGIKFDDGSWIYPCRIPHQIPPLILKNGNVSLSLVYNSRFVSWLVKEQSVEKKFYENHSGNYIYIVGKLREKEKDGRKYYNLFSRDFILVKEVIPKAKSRKTNEK